LSAESLREALAALGLHCRVEARGALAVLVLEGDVAPLRDPSLRGRALSIASAHGFTHLALEAAVARNGGAAVHSD
jgi:hypothetical protein